jgi:hypothetical protein
MPSLGPTLLELWMRNEQAQAVQQQQAQQMAKEDQRYQDEMLLGFADRADKKSQFERSEQTKLELARMKPVETPEQRLLRELAIGRLRNEGKVEVENLDDKDIELRNEGTEKNATIGANSRVQTANIGAKARRDVEQMGIDAGKYVDAPGGSGSGKSPQEKALEKVLVSFKVRMNNAKGMHSQSRAPMNAISAKQAKVDMAAFTKAQGDFEKLQAAAAMVDNSKYSPDSVKQFTALLQQMDPELARIFAGEMGLTQEAPSARPTQETPADRARRLAGGQ